ncbi:PfkB family carbohydrate kinase [Actinotalea sp. Marseille-Q4924]|uniref:PfkB family carbohydrate kinase n=1 Tax=Actinotalea sp. Marseille-Q4924 TaxID=2866571 RepID=UPI001CE47187|nr:PfkB family carbohydrate kinase [Actinotalea sp. Marseille-Q4924]
MPSSPLVLACGLTTLDVRQTVDRVPGPDEKVVARDLAVEVGGPAANAATTSTALGVPVRLLTRVGGAPAGRLVTEELLRLGVELVDHAAPDDAPAVSTVLVTAATGQRAVASVNATRPSRGGPAAGGPEAVHAALDGVTAVLVDGHHLDLAVPVARAACARGVVVLLDGGSWKPGLERLLEHVDVAVLSADFRLPDDHDRGDLLDAVRALGPRAVAQSHGPDAVTVRHAGRTDAVPVPLVDVVDTLGAGDVLHGAAVAWLACAAADRGPTGSAPSADDAADAGGVTIDALRFAVDVASASCAAAGARGWTADRQAVDRYRAALPR